MVTAAERLRNLRKETDPNSALLEALNMLMGSIQTLKGEKGDTPVKGKDYFTEEDIGAIISFVQGQIRVPNDGKDGKDGAPGERGAQGPRGEKGDKGDTGKQGPKGEKGDPGKDAPEVKLDKLVSSVIEELLSSQQWQDMERQVLYNKFDQRWHGGGSGQVVLIADLTDQCDGIKTTFTIPSFSRALKLESTQFPIIYRPDTDWTASGTSLSLGTGVGAPQTGQTLLFYYVA